MRMSAAFLLMEDDDTRLAFEAKFGFDALQRLLERFDGHVLARRRAEAKREHKLLTARSLAYGIGFLERALYVTGNESANFVYFNVLVVLAVEQVFRKLAAAATL